MLYMSFECLNDLFDILVDQSIVDQEKSAEESIKRLLDAWNCGRIHIDSVFDIVWKFGIILCDIIK